MLALTRRRGHRIRGERSLFGTHRIRGERSLFGATKEEIQTIASATVNLFKSRTSNAGGAEVFEALGTAEERDQLQVALISLGANPETVRRDRKLADTRSPAVGQSRLHKKRLQLFAVLSALSLGASTYHGYKRNQSIGWALVWGLFGAMFPVVTPAIALAQGFGKRK